MSNRSALPLNAKTTHRPIAAVAAIASFVASSALHAQVIGPDFKGSYEIFDLGSVPDVPANYGGLVFAPGDPSILLLGGAANSMSAALYAVTLTRADGGSVVGFNCSPTSYFVATPGVAGGIDGGVDVGPGGVLFYTTYSDNHLGQIKSDSTGPDRLINLSTLGVAASTGTLRFVPPDFAGAGRLKIVSYNTGFWYDATVSPDGNGTYDITVTPGHVPITGGPEGVVYIKNGSPGFTADSVLVSNYATGQILAYEIDSNGDPLPATQRVFMSGLSGAEGAAIDPVTGDFFFSTFGGGNRIIRVAGFTGTGGCPADINLDSVVDGADLAIVLGNWGATSGSIADLNGNCVVDGADLAVVLGGWGACP